MPLDIDEVSQISVKRALRWHVNGLADWSPLEWAGAMAGEAGEAANAAKKLRRMDMGIQSINRGDRHFTEKAEARAEIVKEACDTILYALLLIASVNGNPEAALREVFNKKSEEYGFPERI